MAAVNLFAQWLLPIILAGIPLYGYLRGVKVYETFIEGAEEGLAIALRIFPFVLAIFIAVGMFRTSGLFDLLARGISPFTAPFHIPADVIPVVLLRPLSGSATLGLVGEVMKTHGADAFVSRLAAVVQGSSDTTFFVLTLYFGSVGVRDPRYALPVGLIGDAVGFVAAILVCGWIFG